MAISTPKSFAALLRQAVEEPGTLSERTPLPLRHSGSEQTGVKIGD